ncbi:hypothetical protein CH373_00120 [Leptospira perolatii]|uniref:Uncharacterized protein n=1 Tax=Leptospira perolatii TaxID=2023191 RepID=A0A2M9ZT21_9LEPT|nr:hypothetical protein CH360_00120 [Leptospira perolatii]PJZ75154.1 hypothetical protein CH373_00120 [Leptospira perolatii]
MRSTISILIFLFFCNCATYWSQRKNDLGDVFTVGVENPGYGLGLRLGPLAAGFVFQGGETQPGKKDLGKGFGLRGGTVGRYRSQQLIFGILGSEKFHPMPKDLNEATPSISSPKKEEAHENQVGEGSKSEAGLLFPELPDSGELEAIDPTEGLDERKRAKSYDLRYLRFYHIPVAERRRKKKEEFFRRYVENLDPEQRNPAIQAFLAQNRNNKDDYPKAFLYEIELYVGLYVGLRVGFNPAELLDFLFGIFGLDLLEDDL